MKKKCTQELTFLLLRKIALTPQLEVKLKPLSWRQLSGLWWFDNQTATAWHICHRDLDLSLRQLKIQHARQTIQNTCSQLMAKTHEQERRKNQRAGLQFLKERALKAF